MRRSIDKPFLFATLAISTVGLFIFLSAALSLLARQGANIYGVMFNHIVFGLIGGIIAAYIISHIDYLHIKKFSLYFFILALVLTALVFVPHIGVSTNGSHRWVSIFGKAFQPSEILKIASILYLATILSNLKDKVMTIKYGLLSFIAVCGTVGVLMALEPDIGTFLILATALLAMFVAAGGRFKHIGIILIIGVIALSGLVMVKPYLKARIMTFINPASNPLESGYQIQQSLIAIGSGGTTGRGFGQSLQKFNFLPEAISDSIFAVASEEFGFAGSVIIILLLVFFTVRGLKIASNVNDSFGRLVTVGLVIMLITQAYLNISAMLGIVPLSGDPLPFISQGGTALLFEFVAVGIIFNISKHQKA